MTFFHELPVLPKGGAKFKALATGSFGSLETSCFLEHAMTKLLFFFPKIAPWIIIIKLHPVKDWKRWRREWWTKPNIH